MSFAKETKRDLCGKVIENECCKRALLYGILLFSNTFSHSKIKLITESEPLKNLCVSEIKRQFGITPNEYESEKGTKDNRYSSYKLTVSQRGDLARIFDLLDFGYDESLVKIKKEIISCRECERAFIRGVFLSSGTVSNPEVSYHLEMTTPYMELSKGLSKLLKKQGLEPNISVRNNDFVIYYKDGEKIS